METKTLKQLLKLIALILVLSYTIDKVAFFSLNAISDNVMSGQAIGKLNQFLKETQHPIRDILTDKVLFKSYLNKIDINARKQVMGVELYLEKLERSNAFKVEDIVEQSLYFALHQPHSSLSTEHRDLIHKLLINIAPKDVLFLYWYDKEQFYKSYNAWNDSFKDWVIERISNNI